MLARPLSLLATAALSLAVLVGLPATADAAEGRWEVQARTWSVPRSVSAKADLSNAELEDTLMVEINAARAAHGLRKIWSFDACTDGLSEEWGQRIARTGLFEHRDQGQVIRRCRTQWAGEALVRGTGLAPAQMVQLWLDSAPHREILLSPQARRAGVAITTDSQGRVIGVLNLVRPR